MLYQVSYLVVYTVEADSEKEAIGEHTVKGEPITDADIVVEHLSPSSYKARSKQKTK